VTLSASELAHAIGEGREKRQPDGSFMVPCWVGTHEHDAKNPGVHVSEGPDKPLYKCHKGCSQQSLTESLKARGLLGSTNGKGGRGGCTLAAFASAKALPIEFLRDYGVRDAQGKYGPVVEFNYLLEDRSRAPRSRVRYALGGRKKFCWNEGQGRPVIYGLWRLPQAREAGELFIVEGESDALTQWHHSKHALGVPGAPA
jgi:putative DNA primase/helicase